MSNSCLQCGALFVADASSCPACGSPRNAAQPAHTSRVPAAAIATAAPVTLRARVLRDAATGTGLISAQGRQYAFTLEDHWRSDVAPAANMVVDARFTPAGTLLDVQAVPDATQNQEKVKAAVDDAREIATQTLHRIKTSGTPLVAAVVAKMGYANLAALGLLVIGWFFLNTVSIQVTAGMNTGLSFYDILRALHSLDSVYALGSIQQASAGLYGFLCYATLALCIAPFFVASRPLWLGLASPLALFLAVFAGLYWKISSAVGALAGSGDEASQMAGSMVREMAGEMLKALSPGLGFYLSLAAALFLAFRGVTRYLAR
ncbi:hypothetical protein [Paraburkholderia sp. J12]|uniref:hypothetical protein n=1 Tax=Paraburkholderia sp. J12 TaxID=2805432 RepID=UPI002ABDB072|nr:hypothetical protein [Paraburkholderia sp. J12]